MVNSGTAVVTGASAGIGEQYARQLADRGYDLVLVARREHRLRRLADELATRCAVRVETCCADLGRPDGLAAVEQRLVASDVTLLVNNAGINGYGRFVDVAPDVLDAVVTLNVDAPLRLARVGLPGMLERGAGAVINVASLLAFSGAVTDARLPERATYAATKSFLVTWSRLLAAETAGTGVTVQVVCPGYTASEFHLSTTAAPVSDQAAATLADQPRAMPAEDVVRASLLALDRGELVCVPGLADPSALDALAAAEALLRSGSRRELADRYRSQGTGNR
ncbi:MAG TPA: SDR family NAD(P)-dependent oxidoreductase [Frankiaceae bacterium]